MVTDRTITPYHENPYTWPSREQCEAFAAALTQLGEEYPVVNVDQFLMAVDMARKGQPVLARNYAWRSGIPMERIEAIEALLF